MVGRMNGAAKSKERLAARERVAVKEELSSATVAHLPAKQRMLSVLAIAHIIGIRPVWLRHSGIVFLDPPLHFDKQSFLESSVVSEDMLAIVVFRLKVAADRRIELLRIVHHLPPIRSF